MRDDGAGPGRAGLGRHDVAMDKMTGKRESDLRTRNLELFRLGAPEIHARLREVQANSGAAPIGPGPTPSFTVRFTVKAPVRERLDAHTFAFLQGALGRATREGIAFFPEPRAENAYFLVIVGAGQGDAVLGLLERTKSLCLILVEPDPACLLRSFDSVDWSAVFRAVAERDGEIHFLLESDPDRVSANVWRAMRKANPTAADNLTLVVHDHRDLAKRVIRNFADELHLVVSSLGFFYDETLMLANAHRNLGRKNARAFRPAANVDRGLPAFVVGSGPSLDWAMDTLRANAGQAVVIAGGSAIRPLMKGGVAPDFQIEIENIKVSPLTLEVAREHDISGVPLVSACTVDPDAISPFKDFVFFFRKALSPYPLFCRDEDRALPLPAVTVTNAALTFAQAMGFRDIYLFGVDLGSQLPDRHHAKDSYHYTLEAGYAHVPYDMPVEANFGGTCFTNRGLFAARDNMIEAIRVFGEGRRHFNCSDGVAIPGARPMRPADLRLAGPAVDKRQAVADLMASFPSSAGRPPIDAWPGDAIAGAIDDYVRVLKSRLRAIEDFGDFSFHIPLMQVLRPEAASPGAPEHGAAAAVNILFRGTLYAILIYFGYYLARVADPARVNRFGAIARDELIHRLEAMRALAREHLGGAAPRPPAGAVTAPAGERLPDPLRIPRNASCPCGSGRKYKHCHGKAA